jgi:hypothetical protein
MIRSTFSALSSATVYGHSLDLGHNGTGGNTGFYMARTFRPSTISLLKIQWYKHAGGADDD